jgi:hypothetical protein
MRPPSSEVGMRDIGRYHLDEKSIRTDKEKLNEQELK